MENDTGSCLRKVPHLSMHGIFYIPHSKISSGGWVALRVIFPIKLVSSQSVFFFESYHSSGGPISGNVQFVYNGLVRNLYPPI